MILLVVTVAVGLAAASGIHSAHAGAAAACVRVAGKVARYCGPASGYLSIFAGVLFRNGSCVRKEVNDVQLLQVRIGSRSLDGERTNGGLAFFSFGMSGSRAGSVVAYYRSRSWSGHAVTFRRPVDGGTLFVAEGVGASRGRAIGGFRCSGG